MLVGGCGGEKTFLLHGGCFKYLMSVAKRREVVASYQPGPSSYLDAPQVLTKTRLPKSVCKRVLGELTAAPQRIECARVCLRQGLGRNAFLLGPWPFATYCQQSVLACQRRSRQHATIKLFHP